MSAAISKQSRFPIESLYKQHALYSRREQSRTTRGFYGAICGVLRAALLHKITLEQGGNRRWRLVVPKRSSLRSPWLFHWHRAPDPSLLELLDEGAEDGAVAEVLLDGRLLPRLADALALRVDLVQVHVHPVRESVGLKWYKKYLVTEGENQCPKIGYKNVPVLLSLQQLILTPLPLKKGRKCLKVK